MQPEKAKANSKSTDTPSMQASLDHTGFAYLLGGPDDAMTRQHRAYDHTWYNILPPCVTAELARGSVNTMW
ncbi:hypothetical protein XA68_15163 [Ophiocordyceps unilateralis]|uniref:Uncharacterized protein n=1 Tax=Ophiocordyceps unilateralis TaxID=268505 RepID=A0A2A9P7F2_OPHUN|nr:hypothetical protein XA68_15163 [Ophiocordyceps unilateralis]